MLPPPVRYGLAGVLGGLYGVMVSWVVNCTLVEISVNTFFAVVSRRWVPGWGALFVLLLLCCFLQILLLFSRLVLLFARSRSFYLFCYSVLWYFVYIDRCFGVLENLLFGHKRRKKRVVDGLCWFCLDFWLLMLCSRHTIVQVVSCRQSTVVCYPWDGRLFRLGFFLHWFIKLVFRRMLWNIQWWRFGREWKAGSSSIKYVHVDGC